MSSTTPKPPTDWAKVEVDYRAGIKPLRLIGEENGITHGAIRKRAERDDWTRDLSARIHAKAEQLVSKAMVSRELSKVSKGTEFAVVEANAQAIYTVRMSHRKDITRSKNIFNVLMGELEVTSNPEGQGLIEALMEASRAPADSETEQEAKSRKKRQSELLAKILALPERVDTFKRLVEAQDRLLAMERQAFGIDKDHKDDGQLDTLAEVLRGFQGRSMLPVVERVD